MAEKTNAPEIRFEGFTDPWEQRKFSDLTDRVSIQSSDPDLPQVEYEDIISGEGTLNKDLRDKEGGKTGIKFYAEDVLYGKLRPYLMNWLYPQFNGVAVGDFWVLRVTGCDSSFLYRLVQTDSFQRLANASSGSKMPRADWNLISQSFFAVPADHAEQKAIAKSLAELDSLITLHQRKYDKLCTVKKSMLDKMFPKPGETEPEIRFEGFTDPWEQRKLGEFGSVAMCKRIYKEQTSEQGDVPFFKIGTFGTDPDAFISNELFDYFKRTYPYPTPGTLLISAAGSIGRVVEYQGEKAYFQDSNIVWLEHDHRLNDTFLKPLYSQIEWGLEGSTIKRLYNKDLLSAEVTIPGSGEQKEIGRFFAKLDDLIALHRRKLNILKNTKKSLLDKMFV
ncbi:Type I restriction modification DNA specificity domain protein [Collinsella intestinalis]|uniref:Type I restriction modification DNA specificity domain protein n=1 Tax=Collinsella intestinalis TaxID=147207 RepID=A0A5K1J523_9ACTN|nr:restriction endonuclease subunit S [Collinsella intestinalis]VWL98411.1 Type I restriction modification DNA specificity domain protein [Collinsella intestinalis]